MAVTAVAFMYQWALTTRIARGRGTAAPKARQAEVYRLTSSAFIGLPWPKNAAGMTTSESPTGCDVTDVPFLESRRFPPPRRDQYLPAAVAAHHYPPSSDVSSW